jgi:hypothetical protein
MSDHYVFLSILSDTWVAFSSITQRQFGSLFCCFTLCFNVENAKEKMRGNNMNTPGQFLHMGIIITYLIKYCKKV